MKRSLFIALAAILALSSCAAQSETPSPESGNGASEPVYDFYDTGEASPEAPVTTRMPETFREETMPADGGVSFDEAGVAAEDGLKDYDASSFGDSETPSADGASAESVYDYDDSAESVYDYDDSDRVVFPPEQQPEARAGLLTGGEWCDNDNFDFWRELVGGRQEWSGLADSWRLCTENRVFVSVTKDEKPAENITVKLFAGDARLWEAVTDNRGYAYLFATLDKGTQYVPTHITAERGGKQLAYAEYRGGGECRLKITEESPRAAGLDLMFVIDTTGSMSDELTYLQAELEGVIRRVTEDKQIPVRLGLNFYRDEGDEYTVRGCDFSDDIPKAISVINDQVADGGGDYPEAVERALSCAIREQSWSTDNVKLLFLVLDAPPHDTRENAETLRALLTEAAEKGIRIIPIASSGVDTETEFLCRSFAAATGGTYTFLTDHSGIGGSHLEPTIGYYQVEKLNDMIVRIIEGYLAR